MQCSGSYKQQSEKVRGEILDSEMSRGRVKGLVHCCRELRLDPPGRVDY